MFAYHLDHRPCAEYRLRLRWLSSMFSVNFIALFLYSAQKISVGSWFLKLWFFSLFVYFWYSNHIFKLWSLIKSKKRFLQKKKWNTSEMFFSSSSDGKENKNLTVVKFVLCEVPANGTTSTVGASTRKGATFNTSGSPS